MNEWMNDWINERMNEWMVILNDDANSASKTCMQPQIGLIWKERYEVILDLLQKRTIDTLLDFHTNSFKCSHLQELRFERMKNCDD